MMSSQCCLLTKVEVEGELMSKKSLSPKIFECGTAFLLTVPCLALCRMQSSHSLKVPVTWIPRALVVPWVLVSPSLMLRSLMFFLQGAIADCALLSFVSQRNSNPETQPSQVLIQQSRIILPHVFWPLCCYGGHLISCFPVRVCILGKSRSKLHEP